MNPWRVLLATPRPAALLLLACCSRTPPPWECDQLQAEVTLRGTDLDLRGRVTFVRPQGRDVGTLQLDCERDGHLDNATLLASGKTTAFSDGVPRAVRASEERALAVLAALFAWPGRTAERQASGQGAVVRMGDGSEYTVVLRPETSGDPHHPGRR